MPIFGLSMVLVVIAGCGSAKPGFDARVDLTFDPSPPVVGTANVSLKLVTPDGQPVEAAKVSLEGDMNHAGMTPTFADLKEADPGQYAGTLEFTMGGDWLVLVTATTSDGRQLERKIDVRGVKTP